MSCFLLMLVLVACSLVSVLGENPHTLWIKKYGSLEGCCGCDCNCAPCGGACAPCHLALNTTEAKIVEAAKKIEEDLVAKQIEEAEKSTEKNPHTLWFEKYGSLEACCGCDCHCADCGGACPPCRT